MNQARLFRAGDEVFFESFARDEVRIYGEGPFSVRSALEITPDLCACGMSTQSSDHIGQNGARTLCPHGYGFRTLLSYAEHPQWVVIAGKNGRNIGGYFGTYFRAAENVSE